MLLAEANAVAVALHDELMNHIPALAVANIRFAKPTADHGHSHAPEPIRVSGKLAAGLLEIVDTEAGERFQLRLSRHAQDLRAEVAIDRDAGRIEQLVLLPVEGNHHLLQSQAAPDEPHEFNAKLTLGASGASETLEFRMVEPAHHH